MQESKILEEKKNKRETGFFSFGLECLIKMKTTSTVDDITNVFILILYWFHSTWKIDDEHSVLVSILL